MARLSEHEKIELVRKDGNNIQYFVNPSPDVQFEAVTTTPYAIMYIKDPSEAVQIMAVRQKPSAIVYIKYPTKKVIDISEGYDPDFEYDYESTTSWFSRHVANFFKPKDVLYDYQPRHLRK